MPQSEQFEVLVLGSGTGGKPIAWYMAQSGRRTAVVERRWVGGSCPNIACMPSEASDRKGLRGHFRTSPSAASVTATPPSRRAYVPRSAELRMNRRSVLTSALLVLAARRLPLCVWTSRGEAQEKRASLVWQHGASLRGDLKYPPGFKQFDYVNAKAPKGGDARGRDIFV
jgi:phytoene dehydrogenase-like protein